MYLEDITTVSFHPYLLHSIFLRTFINLELSISSRTFLLPCENEMAPSSCDGHPLIRGFYMSMIFGLYQEEKALLQVANVTSGS